MKAVGFTEFGGPEVLRVLDLPVPDAGPGKVRIRVRAATVNAIDALQRRGPARSPDARPPFVPGMEERSDRTPGAGQSNRWASWSSSRCRTRASVVSTCRDAAARPCSRRA
ncbi:hypothetical protein GCM10010496_32690 [Streptomyces asoensis]|nr:hypothetical protein GCM10010496_32690 [Streptomyces asoensis]